MHMERRLIKRWLSAVVLIVATGTAGVADAADYFARTALAGTNWNAANMWSNTSCAAGGPVAGPPTAADNVIICNGKAVTVNIATANAGSIRIEGGNLATSLTIAGTNVLNVTNASGSTGNVVIDASTAAVTKQLAVNTGTLNVTGNVTINGGTTTNNVANVAQLAVTTGAATVNGALQITAGTATTYVARATLTTGSITVGGDVGITGGAAATADALINVTGVSAGTGFTVGGALNINATVATSSSVTLAAGSLMRVSGNINNGDTLSVGAGTLTMLPLGGANTLTTTNAAAINATTSVTTGTINAHNATVNSGAGAAGLKRMNVGGTGTINVNGNLAITTATSTNGDATVDVTNIGGLLNVTGNVTVTGAAATGRNALLNISTASNAGRGVAIGGALNITSTFAGTAAVTMSAAGLMTVGGNINNGDTLTVAAGTLSMLPLGGTSNTLTTTNAANIAVITSVTTGTINAHNATVDSGVGGTALKRMQLNGAGTINVAGNLNITSATSTGGDATVDITNIAGLLAVTGNVTVTGATVAGRNALLNVSTASNVGRGITIGGSLTTTSSLLGTAVVSLTTAGGLLTVNGAGGVSNGDTITVGPGTFASTNASGTYTNSSAAIVATTTVSTGSLTVAGPLTNATGETISITGAGIVNANGGFSNSGTFTHNAAAGQLFLRGVTNTIDGTFTRGIGTVTMNGSVNQNLSGTALFPPTTAGDGFYNFTVNNAAGVTLGSNVVVRNVITFTTGEVTTGANVLISELTCATSVTRTSGHVIGNFQKFIPAGASTCVFQVGSTGAYAQASLVFNGVAVGGGRLIVRTDTPDHPSIGSSGLNSALSVNRYWTLTLTGVTGTVLPAFTNYGATFTFVNPGDLDVGVTTGNFEIRRFSAAVWNNTTVGTRTGTTTQATGILALGEFAIGEVGAPTPGSFNAFETSTGAGAITGVIRTKRAGVAFSLDVVAILSGAQQAGFTNTVRVDLLGNNTLGVALDGSNCPTSFTVVQTVSPDPTITAGRSTVNFAAVANSWRDVRVRVRFPAGSPTVTSCSTDNFAIRPDAITGFSASHNNRTTAGTATSINSTAFGALVHNAGRPFSFRANAVNGAGSPAITTNYTGAPLATVTACGPGVGFEACTATQGALTVTTTFAAGALSTDTAQYSEVGSFGLQLIDDDFASVDASDGSTLGERRIASSVINVGRFVPDNFAVAFNVPVFAPACTGFTYQGQSFNYSTAPVITLTAREAGGATTALYAGTWWRLTASTLTPATQASRYAAASGTLNLGNLPAVTADPVVRYNGDALPSPPAAGTGTLTFSSGTGLSFTRNNATPASELDAEIALSVNIIDADNVTYASNPAAFGAASAGNGILFSDGNVLTTNDKRVRYGRLRMGGASGSQLLAMRIPVEAQYWNGSVFVTNLLDSCTTLSSTNVGLGNFGGALNSGETTASIVNSPLQSGRSAIQLSAPGAANAGSVDVTLNLGSGANADACAAFAPAAAAGNLAHLRGLWCNPPNTYTKDPSVRARFGINRGSDQSIYRREQ